MLAPGLTPYTHSNMNTNKSSAIGQTATPTLFDRPTNPPLAQQCTPASWHCAWRESERSPPPAAIPARPSPGPTPPPCAQRLSPAPPRGPRAFRCSGSLGCRTMALSWVESLFVAAGCDWDWGGLGTSALWCLVGCCCAEWEMSHMCCRCVKPVLVRQDTLTTRACLRFEGQDFPRVWGLGFRVQG